jgi:hypothetical protein
VLAKWSTEELHISNPVAVRNVMANGFVIKRMAFSFAHVLTLIEQRLYLSAVPLSEKAAEPVAFIYWSWTGSTTPSLAVFTPRNPATKDLGICFDSVGVIRVARVSTPAQRAKVGRPWLSSYGVNVVAGSAAPATLVGLRTRIVAPQDFYAVPAESRWCADLIPSFVCWTVAANGPV